MAIKRVVTLGALATLVLGAPLPALAQTVDATSTTLLVGHADPRDGKTYTVVPTYEMISLEVSQLRIPYLDDVRIQLSGWGMAAFGDTGPAAAYPNPNDKNNVNYNCSGGTSANVASNALGDGACVTGDLDLGHLEAKLWKRRIKIDIGRQFIVGGAARVTQIDGLNAEIKFWRGLGVQVYGGAPVTPRFGTSRGDALGGGRLFYRYSTSTEVGASAIYVLGDGRAAREDVALDARYRATPQITFTGYGLYSLRELRIGEATFAVTAQPWRTVDITADYRRIAPDLFLPANSIFAVFSQETRDEAGIWISVRPRLRLRLSGDYHVVIDAAGVGHRGALKGTYAIDNATTLGLETRLVYLPDKGFVDGRLFGLRRLGEKVSVTLDLDALWLTEAINGRDYSLTASATVGYDFAPGWRTVLTAIGDVGPFVDGRLEVMAKLVYNYTRRFHEVTQAASPTPVPEVQK